MRLEEMSNRDLLENLLLCTSSHCELKRYPTPIEMREEVLRRMETEVEAQEQLANRYVDLMCRVFRDRFNNGGELHDAVEADYGEQLDTVYLQLSDANRKRVDRTFCTGSYKEEKNVGNAS